MVCRRHLGGTGEVDGQDKNQYTLVRAKTNRMLSHLPRRPPVEIEYLDINYKVSKGRKGTVFPSLHNYEVDEGTPL